MNPQHRLVAAHRLGLGEPTLAGVGADARGWLAAQLGPADAPRGTALPSAADGVRAQAEYRQRVQQARRASAPAVSAVPGEAQRSSEQDFAEHFRALVLADVRSRLATAALTQRPLAERLALFWANHFTVSMAKAGVRGLVGAFEREAIRPHIDGSFETLLKAAVKHAAMLRYLDNDASAGPRSRVVQRRARAADEGRPQLSGLNENLAREVLELHTLGVTGGGGAYGGWGGYTQADVTAFAAVLTGWRIAVPAVMAGDAAALAQPVRFDPAWHEPGPKTVLGRRYPEGEPALDALLHDLAQHQSTARFVAYKLARHFVADDPPPALVARLETAFRLSGGELRPVYTALLDAPETWAPAPAKLKTPEEFVVSTARLLQWGTDAFERPPDAGLSMLGQRLLAAPSPAGWPDRAADWLGPDAVWKRVEWATRVAARAGRHTDARALAQASLGPALSAETARQVERAADGPQALALLLLSPEFQRR